MNKLDGQLGSLGDVLNGPGSVLNGICSGAESVISGAGDFFQDVGEGLGNVANDIGKEIGSWFGRRRRRRRRKRSSGGGCGIPPVVPDVDVNVPGLDTDALEKWIKSKAIQSINRTQLFLSKFHPKWSYIRKLYRALFTTYRVLINLLYFETKRLFSFPKG